MIKYTFLRKSNGHAIGCVAYEINKELNVVKYGVSCVHTKERFNRTLAREIAEKNMTHSLSIKFESAWHLYQSILEDMIKIDKTDKIILQNSNSTITTLPEHKRNFSDKVIKSAKLWLKTNKR